MKNEEILDGRLFSKDMQEEKALCCLHVSHDAGIVAIFPIIGGANLTCERWQSRKTQGTWVLIGVTELLN